MKSHLKIIFLVLVLTILAILFWLQPVRRTGTSISMPRLQAEIQNSNVQSSSTNVSDETVPVASVTTNSQATVQNDRATLAELAPKIVESGNKLFDFYGLVIDQNSNPVPNVKILVEAQQWYLASPTEFDSKSAYFETSTGADGKFEIHGKGTTVNLQMVQRAGYTLSQKTARAFRIDGKSLNKSIIIKIWKELETKEPLVTGSHVFGIDSGKTYTLNLVTGKKIEGAAEGDLRVSITRPSQINSKDRYSWSYSIEAVQGGLLEANPDDEFMYLAPESGYEPKLFHQFDPTDLDWKLEVNKQFFIRTRDGKVYGRVQVTVYAAYNVHSAIEVNYAINPNGSRNLQP
jgi:hypothetical protein